MWEIGDSVFGGIVVSKGEGAGFDDGVPDGEILGMLRYYEQDGGETKLLCALFV